MDDSDDRFSGALWSFIDLYAEFGSCALYLQSFLEGRIIFSMRLNNKFSIKARRLIFNLLIFSLSIVVLFFIGEILVRIFPLISDSFISFRFRQYDTELGISLRPNSKGPHHRGCFKGEIQINSWGMRDRERTIEKDNGVYRIVLLGDSVLEGVHVRSSEVVNIRMEKNFADSGLDKIEVLNFGIAGLGTSQEFLLYKKRAQRFDPDLVVLLFLTSNDVMDNSSKLKPMSYGIHKWYAPYFDLGPNGELIFREVNKRKVGRLGMFLENHSALTYHIQRVWARLDIGQLSWHGISLYWGVYGDPLDKEWEEAWKITEKVLTLLKDTVERNGAKFLVLVLPENYEYDQDWKKRIESKEGNIPISFNPFAANSRLREIGVQKGITLDFLGPYFKRYKEKHSLSWPYFSFSCDTHFSSLGHEVLANSIIEQIYEHHLLKSKEAEIR